MSRNQVGFGPKREGACIGGGASIGEFTIIIKTQSTLCYRYDLAIQLTLLLSAHGSGFVRPDRGQCRCIKAEIICARPVKIPHKQRTGNIQ